MHYLLVHGSWHGSWCWDKLIPHLESKGHSVSCVNFPGYEGTEAVSTVTYQDYYNCVEKAILAIDAPLTLVAHSMSGIVCAPLLEKYSERIDHAYFVAAWIPEKGDSLLSASMRYEESEIPKIIQHNRETGICTLDPSGVRGSILSRLRKGSSRLAIKHLRPQPYTPNTTEMDWEDTLSTKDKRTYIICEKDRGVSPRAQRDNIKWHPMKEKSIDAGHFPFLSQPKKFAELIT